MAQAGFTKTDLDPLDLDEDEKYNEQQDCSGEATEDPHSAVSTQLIANAVARSTTLRPTDPLPRSPPAIRQSVSSHLSLSPPSIAATLPRPHLVASWRSDVRFQSERAQLFVAFIRCAFRDSSGQTQLCVLLLSVGSFLVLVSLPKGMMMGALLLSLGTLGIADVLRERWRAFSREHGLISYLPASALRDFLLSGSIVDIFYEVRNSRLGIPDFVLSQLLPMDDSERQLIFEKLPPITRSVATTF